MKYVDEFRDRAVVNGAGGAGGVFWGGRAVERGA